MYIFSLLKTYFLSGLFVKLELLLYELSKLYVLMYYSTFNRFQYLLKIFINCFICFIPQKGNRSISITNFKKTKTLDFFFLFTQ